MSAQIRLRIVIEDKRLSMYSFEAFVCLAILVVNGDDNTSPERPVHFRFGDNRRIDRPMVATDPSREIHNRPEEELDVFDSQSHDIDVSLAGRVCMLRGRQGMLKPNSEIIWAVIAWPPLIQITSGKNCGLASADLIKSFPMLSERWRLNRQFCFRARAS